MKEQYDQLPTGVIHQLNYEKIEYNYDYSNNYNSHGERGVQFAYLRLGVLLGILGKTPDSLLDVGYGNGDFLKVASQTIPHCYGADLSDYPVPPLCKKVDLDEKRYYDVICFFDSLEHFDDIDIIGRLDCAHVFISLPWCHHFTDTWFEKWCHRKPNEHLWHFNQSALISHFESHGYECVYSSNYEDIIRRNAESANYPNILSCLFKKKQTIETRFVEFYSGKSVVVTGGTGFVGRHIVDALLSYPVKHIYVVDRTLKYAWTDTRVTLLTCDLTKDLEMIRSLEMNLLFHEAANVDTTDTNEQYMTAINVIAFQKLIDICEEKGATLIYASSAAVYGNSPCPNSVGQQENPLNIYGMSKLNMDNYVRNRPVSSSPIVGLRYFNVYGPGEEHKGSMMSMISQMIRSMQEHKDVRLFEWGEQRRDFIYVKDVARCNLLAGMNSISGIYNCGSGKSISFNELFQILSSYFRDSLTIQYIHNPYPFFQIETTADIKDTITILGFTPLYDACKGIYNMMSNDIKK